MMLTALYQNGPLEASSHELSVCRKWSMLLRDPSCIASHSRVNDLRRFVGSSSKSAKPASAGAIACLMNPIIAFKSAKDLAPYSSLFLP